MTGLPLSIDLDQVRIDPAWALRIPASLGLRKRVLPFAVMNGKVYVACLDPQDSASLDAVTRFTGQQAIPVRVDAVALQRALARVFGDGARSSPSARAENHDAGDDAIALSEELLRAAVMR